MCRGIRASSATSLDLSIERYWGPLGRQLLGAACRDLSERELARERERERKRKRERERKRVIERERKRERERRRQTQLLTAVRSLSRHNQGSHIANVDGENRNADLFLVYSPARNPRGSSASVRKRRALVGSSPTALDVAVVRGLLLRSGS